MEMLLTDFYQIISTEANGPSAWTVDVELNSAHAIYKGHFPEHPVVPGVCTLQIIKECISGILNCSLQYGQISSCKFLSAINPVATPVLKLLLQTKELENNQIQLTAEGVIQGAEFIKLKATLTVKE